MTPFVYPKSRHVRREKPGELSAYQKYKPFLQREFERKCIYCRVPDSMKDHESYGVEHYRPKSKYPNLATSYSNLFYACNPCNRRKGDYWPPNATAKTHFVPNPCDHEMFKHLRFSGAIVEPKSTAGETAIALLDLNDSETVAYRNFINDMIGTTTAKKAEFENVRAQLVAQRDSGSANVAKLSAAIAKIDRGLDVADTHLKRLRGH